MGTADLQSVLRLRLGLHVLLIQRYVACRRLWHTGVLGSDRHKLLECPVLADLRVAFSSNLTGCSGVMARLV